MGNSSPHSSQLIFSDLLAMVISNDDLLHNITKYTENMLKLSERMEKFTQQRHRTPQPLLTWNLRRAPSVISFLTRLNRNVHPYRRAVVTKIFSFCTRVVLSFVSLQISYI